MAGGVETTSEQQGEGLAGVESYPGYGISAGLEGSNSSPIADGLDGEIATSTGLDVDGIGTDGGATHLKIHITSGTEAEGHGAVLDKHALNGDALGGADIYRRGVFHPIED